MLKGILTGAALAAAAGLAGAYLFVSLGLMPANADSRPPRLESWAAHKSLKAALARQAPRGDGPLAVNDGNVLAGVRLYAANCAVCHGANPNASAPNLFSIRARRDVSCKFISIS